MLLSVLPGSEPDKRKFLEIYELHKKKMLYTAFKILHNQHDAEDAVQEAFLAIARHLDAIDNPADYRTAAYVTITAKNMALKIWHKNRNSPVLLEELDYEITDPLDVESRLCLNEELKTILNAVYKLNNVYRDVLCYHYLYDLSAKEIADLLGRNINTVKSQLKHGKSILLASIKGEQHYEEQK